LPNFLKIDPRRPLAEGMTAEEGAVFLQILQAGWLWAKLLRDRAPIVSGTRARGSGVVQI
jgi:hypothetical protein